MVMFLTAPSCGCCLKARGTHTRHTDMHTRKSCIAVVQVSATPCQSMPPTALSQREHGRTENMNNIPQYDIRKLHNTIGTTLVQVKRSKLPCRCWSLPRIHARNQASQPASCQQKRIARNARGKISVAGSFSCMGRHAQSTRSQRASPQGSPLLPARLVTTGQRIFRGGLLPPQLPEPCETGERRGTGVAGASGENKVCKCETAQCCLTIRCFGLHAASRVALLPCLLFWALLPRYDSSPLSWCDPCTGRVREMRVREKGKNGGGEAAWWLVQLEVRLPREVDGR